MPALLASQPTDQRQNVLIVARQPLEQLGSGGTVPKSRKWREQPLHDTEILTALNTPRELTFFSSVTYQGGALAGVAKSPADQFLPGNGLGGLENQAFVMTGVRIGVVHDPITGLRPSIRDLQQLRAFLGFEFQRGSKPIWRRPVEAMPAPGLHSALSAAANTGFVNLGSSSVVDGQDFPTPVVMEDGMDYGVALVTSDGLSLDADVRIRIWLEGFLRLIQR